MLQDLIHLVEPHQNEYPELYEYLMMTWTSCHYDSTLYACSLTGSIMLQKHLTVFDDENVRFYQKERQKGIDL
jgi:hypothetical protein